MIYMIDFNVIESFRQHVINKIKAYKHTDEELMQNIAWAFTSACFIADGKNLSTEETIDLCKQRVKAYTDEYYGDYIDIE